MHEKHPFNLRLEQYLLGELPQSEMLKIENELKTNHQLRQELDRLEAETKQYYDKFPRLNFPPKPNARPKNTWWAFLTSPALAGGLAFATATLLVVLFLPETFLKQTEMVQNGVRDDFPGTAHAPVESQGVRTKGLMPALFLSMVHEGTVRELSDNDLVRSGDEIKIAYRASGYAYGVIVSVDSQKEVTLFLPATKDSNQLPLESGGKVALRVAYQLDAKPGYETFFFIASKRSMSVPKIMQELQATGSIKSSSTPDLYVVKIRLKKE